MLKTKLFVTGIFLFATNLALASGGGGYGGGGFGSSSPQPRPVDRTYEYGKSIYLGRDKAVGKIKYCVDVGEEKKKLKRSTLKPFKNTDYNTLAENLYDCDTPDVLVSSKMDKSQLAHVIYYLNKRYKLSLGS